MGRLLEEILPAVESVPEDDGLHEHVGQGRLRIAVAHYDLATPRVDRH